MPEFGNVSVNPDNTMALVLTQTQQTGQISFGYEVTYADGSVQTVQQSLTVTPGTQDLGWGAGDFYQLEIGEDGNFVVEHGDDHREIYVSNSPDALTAADIARIANVDVSQVNGHWLANNPQFGSGPETALAPEIGMDLWRTITNDDNTSNWLLFESGYTYSASEVGKPIANDAHGESELHPLYIGAYGEGAKPIVESEFNIFGSPNSNIVIQGLHLTGKSNMLTGENIIFDDVVFTEEGLNAQNIDSLTIRNVDFFDAHRDEPNNGADDWTAAHSNRFHSLYISKSEHVLMDGIFVDQIGWEDDYRADLGGDGGQPPSIYTQNIYIQSDASDVTLRDSISMRAASMGVQLRPGGVIEDSVFIDNNGGLAVLGGDYRDAGPVGNYSLITGNVITSGAHKTYDGFWGALTQGLENNGYDTGLVDNLVTHLANPDDPQEQQERSWTHEAMDDKKDPYFNDTIVYNWIGSYHTSRGQDPSPDTNVDGLDTDLLDETTIQRFAGALLGKETATIAELGDYLQGIADGSIDDSVTADDIRAYFNAAFGLEDTTYDTPMTVRFVPDDRGDGVRWDNPLNWTTDERPQDGDTVDLASNWVSFGGTVSLQDLYFGDNGWLGVNQGHLEVTGALHSGAGAEIDIAESGQVWVEDYTSDDRLDVDVDGGRFANTGFFDGLLDLHVTDGQALLGVDDAVMELGQGSVLTVEGNTAKVGFDGEAGGVSVLRMEAGSELRMIADGGGFSTIGEVRSGAMETDTPDVLSAFDMGEGTLLIDIGAIAGGAAREEVLVDTDQIVGMFDDVEFIGLGANQDATLTVDYESDKVTVTLGATGQGSGQINVATVGNELDAAEDAEIWDALTESQGTYEEAFETRP
jgi:hypothetical protein